MSEQDRPRPAPAGEDPYRLGCRDGEQVDGQGRREAEARAAEEAARSLDLAGRLALLEAQLQRSRGAG